MMNHVSLKIIYKYEQSVILCMPEECVLSYANKIFFKKFTYQTFIMIQVMCIRNSLFEQIQNNLSNF